MKVYTISERQVIKDRLADERHFDADCILFRKLFPNHVLVAELARANRVNRMNLCRKMIYQLLTRVDEAAILENRNIGTIESTPKHGTITGSSPETARIPAPEKHKKKAGKQDEFPRINWQNNENEDIQLAILLYDERVNTWHRMAEISKTIDEHPELAAELAELDDRNRMAHHELEVFQDTGVFPYKHPLAVAFAADRQRIGVWRKLKAENPDKFMKEVANIRHNIGRYKSELKKSGLSTEKRERLEKNLKNSERLNELMQRVLGE